MTQAITQTLIQTPWWAYAILAYIIIRGVKASKTRTIAIGKIFIFPSIITLLTLLSFIIKHDTSISHIFEHIGALALGAILGLLMFKNNNLKIDKKNKTLTLPGSWSTMGILMSIFIVKYILGYIHATRPDVALKYTTLEIAISGIISGLLIGKAIYYFYKYKQS